MQFLMEFLMLFFLTSSSAFRIGAVDISCSYGGVYIDFSRRALLCFAAPRARRPLQLDVEGVRCSQ